MREMIRKVAQDILGDDLDLSTLSEEDIGILKKEFPDFLRFIDEAEYNVDQARSFYKLLEILFEVSEDYDEPLKDIHRKLVYIINKLPIIG